jgi:hypothetical protein
VRKLNQSKHGIFCFQINSVPFRVEQKNHERQNAEHHELLVQTPRQVHVHVAVFLANLKNEK